MPGWLWRYAYLWERSGATITGSPGFTRGLFGLFEIRGEQNEEVFEGYDSGW